MSAKPSPQDETAGPDAVVSFDRFEAVLVGYLERFVAATDERERERCLGAIEQLHMRAKAYRARLDWLEGRARLALDLGDNESTGRRTRSRPPAPEAAHPADPTPSFRVDR